jgi:uncharacterized protein with FMN-binding domain
VSSKSGSSPNKRATSSLVALGSMAVLGVYAVGYVRTEAAAQRFTAAAEMRRPTAVIARAPEIEPMASTPAAKSLSDGGAKPAVPAGPPKSGTAAAAPAQTKEKRTERAKDSVAAVVPAPAAAAAAVQTAAPPVTTPPVAATPPAAAPVVAPPTDTAAKDEKHAAWKDGAYVGWGTSRHGDIEATVEIRGGKIVSASISQCRTQYSCSWIAALPPQVIARQSADIDYVSGATQSSNALYGAVVDALNKAK